MNSKPSVIAQAKALAQSGMKSNSLPTASLPTAQVPTTTNQPAELSGPSCAADSFQVVETRHLSWAEQQAEIETWMPERWDWLWKLLDQGRTNLGVIPVEKPKGRKRRKCDPSPDQQGIPQFADDEGNYGSV